FGIAVAEAMLSGTPVVISDQVHICPDVKNAQAGWVTDCTVEGLTDNLRYAITNGADRQQRGIRAHDYASQHYSWDAIASQMIQAYEQLL
ncbi:MAG: glycosyltransferase, partial [Cyanobacteriota bacterium]|nr:glycosyltransferase [Cyanobacteriota bacterium]